MSQDDLMAGIDGVLKPVLVARTKQLLLEALMHQVDQLEKKANRALPDLRLRIQQMCGLSTEATPALPPHEDRPHQPVTAQPERRGPGRPRKQPAADVDSPTGPADHQAE